MKKSFNNKYGQLSIINIIFWFILVFVGVILTMILSPIIALAAANESSMNQIVMYAIIPFMWIAIVTTLLVYANPQSGNFRQY